MATDFGVTISPFLNEFWGEQQAIRRQDAANHPQAMQELRRRGTRYPEASLQERLYEVDERAAIDKVAEWLRTTPDTGSIVSYEHDGVAVLDPSGVGDDAWKQRLVDGARQQTGLEFAVKPYRSEAMIWELLRQEHPELDWDTQDLDAYQLEHKRLQLKYYMRDGRSQPDMLVGELIGAQPAPDNSAVPCREVFRTLADARDIEVAAFNEDSRCWHIHTKHQVKHRLVEAAQQVVDGCWKVDVFPPAWTRKSGCMLQATEFFVGQMYDESFMDSMDAKETDRYVLFRGGLTLDRDTKLVERGRRDLFITRRAGLEYPAELAAKWADELKQVFERAKAYEQGFLTAPLNGYPVMLSETFKDLAERLEVVQVLYSFWESWPMVTFILKQTARSLFCREGYEEFLIHMGEGANGKGLWTQIVATLFGEYCHLPSDLPAPPESLGALLKLLYLITPKP
ncbi:unnamed protein product [Symbiodinium natans]|uniref:Uncharacterized protein n=1 Tax=Symbiodinium natans TaxID=878477 RepID=A0A812NSI8_9DINO|nr:unnamed protein product [Symbiodinium natans]